jgi:hypothetical protein
MQHAKLYLALFEVPEDLTNNYEEFTYIPGQELENKTDNEKIDNEEKIANLINTSNSNSIKIYDMRSNNTSEQKTIEEIIQNKSEEVLLITKNKSLFTNFYRPIQLVNSENFANDEMLIDVNMNDILNYIRACKIDILYNNIDKLLFVYGEIFTLDISLLTKETSYGIDVKEHLMEMIQEDLNLLSFKKILTSRLSIILYRLFFFDLNAKATSIGYFYRDNLNVKSKSFKLNSLNNNTAGFYFKNLLNKSFRGYEIPLLKFNFRPAPKPLHREKIKIAKRLLRDNVKIKVVANALKMTEEELKNIIYNEPLPWETS